MNKNKITDISSFGLHVLAMIFMLCDHLWATVVPGHQWLTWIGRMTFPIYAFLIVEGYFHTKDFKKYLRRMLIFAVIAELPFNLMYVSTWIYPFHQNVLWSFVLALLCMRNIDKIEERFSKWAAIPLAIVVAGLFILAAQLLMVDYYGYGVMMVLLFYVFRGNQWYHRLGQLLGMFYINWELISGLVIPVELLGMSVDIPQQGMAVLALVPIWFYKGRQGHHSKAFQYFCYAFYPVHMLILGLL